MSAERRPIPGYEGHYEADADGNIWSLARTVKTLRGSQRLKERKLRGVNRKGYLRVGLCINDKEQKKSIHRLVGAAFGIIELNDRKQQIDHINHNKKDNRLSNLRQATASENHMWGGKTPIKSNKSGFRGVSWHKHSKKWQAAIKVNRKSFHLGLFTCRIAAAIAYDDAAVKHFGEFANLNFEPQKTAA